MSHVDESFFDDLMDEFAYSPKLSDREAIRVIFDLAAKNGEIYRKLTNELGKPSRKENPDHAESFYNTLRANMRKAFSVDEKTFLPFIPVQITMDFQDAMGKRDRKLLAEVAQEAARLYHEDPRAIDRFALKANYIEGVQ